MTLGRGERIVADDAYVRESILDPARNVVAGYNPLMPPYRGHLTDAEVDDSRRLRAFARCVGRRSLA